MRGRRRDAIERACVELWRDCGCSWMPHDAASAGEPDGVLGWPGPDGRGRTDLVEIKSGAKVKCREAQIEWHRRWRGSRVVLVRSVDDAARLIGGTIRHPA